MYHLHQFIHIYTQGNNQKQNRMGVSSSKQNVIWLKYTGN